VQKKKEIYGKDFIEEPSESDVFSDELKDF